MRRKRLEQANSLLATSDDSIEKIAFSLGFTNQAKCAQSWRGTH
ncbi:MAG: hypothetical protein JO025_14190 [Verrucomicrobia bacterium]|nr:hypothetical protein [Verrucomicrobiota bacterium]